MPFNFTPRPEPIEPHAVEYLQEHHQALLMDDSRTDEAHVATFRILIGLLVHWRVKTAEVAVKRIAVEPVLDDPANADHPSRRLWSATYWQMCEEEGLYLEHVVIETWHLNGIWQHMIPRQRRDLGLGTLTGVHYAQQYLGRELPFITKGPLQDAAPLPNGYEPPPGFIERMTPNFRNMLDIVPF